MAEERHVFVFCSETQARVFALLSVQLLSSKMFNLHLPKHCHISKFFSSYLLFFHKYDTRI